MKLNDLKPAKGAVRSAWRKGQGPGSGNGKTAGRGTKGQRSRSGASLRSGFEGGQMPLYRRIPKRGFHNLFRTEYSIVNLGRLNEVFADGDEVTIDTFRERGLVSAKSGLVKVLGNGDFGKRLVVHAHKVSASAKKKIEDAGGRVELAQPAGPVAATPESKS